MLARDMKILFTQMLIVYTLYLRHFTASTEKINEAFQNKLSKILPVSITQFMKNFTTLPGTSYEELTLK